MNILVTGTLYWIGLAVIEMIHGIMRAKLLAPKVGDLRSRQIGVFTGSVLILLYTNLIFTGLDLQSPIDAIYLGALWFFLMLVFELTVGHYVFRFPWKWLLNDLNILKGRLLALGMLVLFFAPWLIGRAHGLW